MRGGSCDSTRVEACLGSAVFLPAQQQQQQQQQRGEHHSDSSRECCQPRLTNNKKRIIAAQLPLSLPVGQLLLVFEGDSDGANDNVNAAACCRYCCYDAANNLITAGNDVAVTTTLAALMPTRCHRLRFR